MNLDVLKVRRSLFQWFSKVDFYEGSKKMKVGKITDVSIAQIECLSSNNLNCKIYGKANIEFLKEDGTFTEFLGFNAYVRINTNSEIEFADRINIVTY